MARFLERDLATRGFAVQLQPVTADRFNIFAHGGGGHPPRVVLCTHLDTVPPFIASSEDEGFIYGRGACDAKGILAAMTVAADALRAKGHHEVGLLFVVGEETDSIGALKANELAPASRYVLVGEPTENKLASGHKGSLEVVLRAEGTAAHSAYPELGDSAVHRLLDALERVRRTSWGHSDHLGDASVNIGTLSGGEAGNVVAPGAEARVFIRVVGSAADARRTLDAIVGEDPKLSYDIVTSHDAVSCETIPGFDTTPVSFGSDIPALTAFGKPLMLGPGSIRDAHGPNERIAKQDVDEAVNLYCKAVMYLMDAGS